MSQATFNFPRGFFWGTTTSAYQVEGNNFGNNWYAWEKSDQIIHRQSCGLACDWWGGRWREDFDRAAEAGQNAHRLSVEWSRIQPDHNEDALDHYRQMIRGLLERGIRPIITLHHFAEPLWVSELGGWQSDAILEHFLRFVRKTTEALQEYASWWCTINEPNVYVIRAYLLGDFPPGKKSFSAVFKVIANMIKGHAAAYQVIHEIQPQARVGIAHQYRGFQAAKRYSPLDLWVTKTLSQSVNNAIPRTLADGTLRFMGVRKRIPNAKGTQDYFGMNYFSREMVSFDFRAPQGFFIKRFYPPEADLSPNGIIANEPDGFFEALQWAKGFKLPIIVTGNGTEDSDGSFRSRYLVDHIHKLWHAVNFNWNIQGYFHRSLIDTFEWDSGWKQRFGLWGLDTDTQERHKRKSVDLFTAICQGNERSSDVVARYTPEAFDRHFPP